jgi:hypothetical protein
VRYLIGLALWALSLTAVADELIVTGLTRHSKYNHDSVETETYFDKSRSEWMTTSKPIRAYNNVNPGLGYRTDDGLLFGVYKNSFYRTTFYLGGEVMANRYFGGFAALATGYKEVSHLPVTVIGGLIVKAPITDRLSLNLMFLPPLGRIDGVATIALAWRL